MKRALAVLIIISLSLGGLMALKVSSVRAVDSGNRSSRITIRLTEEANFSFNSSGTQISVNIPNAGLETSSADYRRLSHIIDSISLRQDTQSATVMIRTMDQYQVSHRREGRLIFVDIVNPTVPEPRPQAPAAAVQRSSTPATPPREEAPAVAVPEPAPADSIPPPVTVPPPAVMQPQAPGILECVTEVVEANLIIYTGILGLCLLLLIWLYIIVFRGPVSILRGKAPKAEKAPKASKSKARLDLGLDGATLIMDSDTKRRMVNKLQSEGWTVRQIAQEMKLPAKEIESIVRQAQMSDHDS